MRKRSKKRCSDFSRLGRTAVAAIEEADSKNRSGEFRKPMARASAGRQENVWRLIQLADS